jgi:hypothetical protein
MDGSQLLEERARENRNRDSKRRRPWHCIIDGQMNGYEESGLARKWPTVSFLAI